MNEAHFHLIINHFPIIIPVVGMLILLSGFLIKSPLLKRVAYCLFILGALFTIPAFASGEAAEEVVEHMNGVSEHRIHEHEEVAETFSLLIYLLGGFSLIALWAQWKQKSFSKIISWGVALFALVVLFYAQQTGTSGGEIQHPEIRKDFQNTSPLEGTTNQNTALEEDHDTDDDDD